MNSNSALFGTPCRDPHLRWNLAYAAVQASFSVQASINSLGLQERLARMPSPLKPPPETAAQCDAKGEEAAFCRLDLLARELNLEVKF